MIFDFRLWVVRCLWVWVLVCWVWVCVILLSVFITDFGWYAGLFIVLPLASFASDLLRLFGFWVLGCCLFRCFG